jgi:hypothetical protein
MMRAGFSLGKDGNPGTWMRIERVGIHEHSIPVDLLVPSGALPADKHRGARLGPIHGNSAARKAVGLEAALVDNSILNISALEATDARTMSALVAGEAALLVAKAHKIYERSQGKQRHRVNNKDAGDVVRLMKVTDPRKVGLTFIQLCESEVSSRSSSEALLFLNELFGKEGSKGTQMAVRALGVSLPQEQIRTLCTSYVSQLLETTGKTLN